MRAAGRTWGRLLTVGGLRIGRVTSPAATVALPLRALHATPALWKKGGHRRPPGDDDGDEAGGKPPAPKHQPLPPPFSLAKYEEALKAVTDECQRMFARLILATKTPQSQVAALRVKTGQGMTSLAETGWPIAKTDNAGQFLEVTTPSAEDAKAAADLIKRDFGDTVAVAVSKDRLTLQFQLVTGEYKEQLLARAKGRREQFKHSIRNARNAAVKSIEAHSPSREEEKRLTKLVQDRHDKALKALETSFAENTKKLMSA